jgi:hypothetical protein
MKLNDTGWTAVLCSVSTGALFAASRDIAPFGPLILVAPVPILLYALASDRLWRVFAASMGARAIGAAALVYAYADALPPVLFVVIIATASVEFAVVIVLTRLAAQRLPVWAATLSFPAFVTAAEFLAQLLSPHGTFGALGYALSDAGPRASGKRRRRRRCVLRRGGRADDDCPDHTQTRSVAISHGCGRFADRCRLGLRRMATIPAVRTTNARRTRLNRLADASISAQSGPGESGRRRIRACDRHP